MYTILYVDGIDYNMQQSVHLRKLSGIQPVGRKEKSEKLATAGLEPRVSN